MLNVILLAFLNLDDDITELIVPPAATVISAQIYPKSYFLSQLLFRIKFISYHFHLKTHRNNPKAGCFSPYQGTTVYTQRMKNYFKPFFVGCVVP